MSKRKILPSENKKETEKIIKNKILFITYLLV